jgi:chitodextrinase
MRSAKTLFALVLYPVLALLGLSAPASGQSTGLLARITRVLPSNGIVTVNWQGGTAPYQVEKSIQLRDWQEVDVQTSGYVVQSIETDSKAFYRIKGPGGTHSNDRKAPSVPGGLTATPNTCSQITLSWNPSTDIGSGVASYKVYRNGFFLVTVPVPATVTSDVGLVASTLYSYAVLAVDVAGNISGKCPVVTATTPVCVDNTAPSIPANVTAVPASCTQINISWSPSADNFGGSGLRAYIVFANGVFFKQVLAPATSTSDTGLASGSTRNYMVSALDTAGNQSSFSPVSTATTPICSDTTAPSVPASLTAAAATYNQINLSWAASTDTGGSGLRGYYIYRNGGYLKAVVGATSTSDPGLAASTSYSYAVTAVDNAGNQSAQSTAMSATTPAVQATPFAMRFGGTGTDFGNVVAVDASGNMFVAGWFQATMDLGGGLLVSAGDYDVFVAKYSSSGAHIWSKRFGTTGRDTATCIALAPTGEIYVGGTITGASVIKLSAQGDLLWTKGPADGFASVACDSQGNLIGTGSFRATVDFGDGHSLNSYYSSADAFLVKYSPAGVCLWVKDFANSGDVETGTAVAVDKRNDNIVLAGWSYTDINLGGTHFINGTWGGFGFLGKFTPAGDHVWSATVGLKAASDASTAWSRILAIALDSNGDIALAGQFNVQVNLGAGTITASSGISSGYVGKYSGSDGHYIWAQPIIGGNDCHPYGVAVDAQNNVIMAGYYYVSFNFGGQTLTCNGTVPDCFVAKYSTSGSLAWARSYGGATSDGAYGVAVDGAGYPVVTGYMQDTGTWGGQSLTSAGSYDGFLMKLNP